jgi:Variant SH3 domain
MSTVRAVQAHQIPDRPPLRLSVGQRVTVGQQDTRWPAFVLVTAEAGQGWVPSRHLELDRASGAATVLVPYDTTELATTVGELLTVVTRDDASGWVWVRAADGRQGWVPADTVAASS